MNALLDESAAAPPKARRSPLRSGWIIGVVAGVLIGLIALPTVRTILFAQLQFALSEESVPFVRSLDAHETAREVSRLDATAAAAGDDYLLQVGRATALATTSQRQATKAASPTLDANFDSDHTLFRLAQLAREFPAQPGGYAHLASYMMGERIRVLRPEVTDSMSSASKSASPTAAPSAAVWRRDVRLMEWALHSGALRDPDNAFWPAMLATTYFAAHRDREALEALTLAAHKPHWDAYLYEEVLGQWRLYSATYGDHGATQKIGPLSLIAFPHLYELRHTAEMARWHAEQAAASGHDDEALRIRRNVAMMGVIMRETAAWSYEALIGTDIFFIASTDSDAPQPPGAIQTSDQWERRAPHFLALLEQNGKDTSWTRREVANCCELRQRVDIARYDASFPGVPPGIPLVSLFGCWMTGICLLQQMLLLALAALFAAGAHHYRARWKSLPPLLHRLAFVPLLGVTIGSGTMLFYGVAAPRTALLFLVSLTLVATALLTFLSRLRLPKTEESASTLSRWTFGTTLRMTLLLFLPLLIALYERRYYLSSLHPVAVLLTSIMGIAPPGTPRDACQVALLGGGLTLALVLLISLWSLYRRVEPAAALFTGISRLALPLMLCLSLAYIGLLNQTLHLDSATSRALNEVAQNDLQWVLTHSSDSH